MTIDERAVEIAEKLVGLTSQSSFNFWQQKDFRGLVNFDSISQTEQDRIFNELVVTGIVFLMFILDSFVENIDVTEKKIVMSKVRDKIPDGYLKTLADIGIDRKFRRIWKKLIDMRLREYLDNRRYAKEEVMFAEKFKGKEELKDSWARIETLAIGCLFHIRRGKGKTEDHLWKMLRFWLISLEGVLQKYLGQISKLQTVD